MSEKRKTTSNILLDNFYGDDKSAPGKFPFRSGIYNDMYRGKLWTMRQYAGFTSCEESNKRYKYLSKRVMHCSLIRALQYEILENHPRSMVVYLCFCIMGSMGEYKSGF